jgi:catechol 2,3-dioxygenase-like lactoylglutathione lyase family enzyme
MRINRILAQMTVSDLDVAEQWYTGLFGREPDARPMDGLLEWHLADTFGVQVYLDAERAGRSSMVCDVGDLDDLVAELDAAQIEHPEPMDVTASRVLQLSDADGNLIVFSGPFV